MVERWRTPRKLNALILDDALRAPHAFYWFGAIPFPELDEWTQRTQIQLPTDLLEFWHYFGGGHLFESETILRPTIERAPNHRFVVGDDAASCNESHKKSGMPPHLFIFGTGLFLSAVDLATGTYVTLSQTYVRQAEFNSLVHWYFATLRTEFGQKYGLM